MTWEKRVERYLNRFGYELLKFKEDKVVYRGKRGTVWESSNRSLNKTMVDWERSI